MSDDKKSGGDPREQEKLPIKPEEVVVTVKPKEQPIPKGTSSREAHRIKRDNADKAKRAEKATGDDKGGATKEVRDAIKKAAPGGRDAQKKAAEEAATDVGKKLDRNVFDGVKVDIPKEAPIVAPATEGSPPSNPSPPPPKDKGN
jgi:hypothetical protein